jgi:hypothetical protein
MGEHVVEKIFFTNSTVEILQQSTGARKSLATHPLSSWKGPSTYIFIQGDFSFANRCA